VKATSSSRSRSAGEWGLTDWGSAGEWTAVSLKESWSFRCGRPDSDSDRGGRMSPSTLGEARDAARVAAVAGGSA
jgi:hypothetical protein